jgi:solute:Na+ symporter, SSS family
VILTSLVVLLYILMAGFKAVIVTDVIQSIIIFVLLVIVAVGITGSSAFPDLLKVETGGVDIGVTVGFFLFGLLSLFSYANIYQLCYAAKTKNDVRHGLGLAVLPILFVSFLLLLIGLFMVMNAPGLDSGLVFSEALKRFLPVSLLPLGIVLFFAGIMSSADTNIYAISSHYAISKGSKNLVSSIRWATLVLMIITTIIAVIFTDIVDVSIIVGGMSLVLSFPMVYLFANGRNVGRFIGSTISGIIGLIGGIVFLGIEPVVAIVVIVFGALGLLWNFGGKRVEE